MRKLAAICDLAEENWPSMDLAAEMLLANAGTVADLAVRRVQPSFGPRFQSFPGVGPRRSAFNADRLVHRLWDYPRALKKETGKFDLFHVCDHSYAHLLHGLPAGRTGVFCHDLDTFRCILEPGKDRRGYWFRHMARHILTGMQKAARVFFTTDTVRSEILRHGLIEESRLVKAPYGISAEFTPAPQAPGGRVDERFILHVGSCIPRKRIDVLLEVFAGLRESCPDLKLLQVGGEWTPAQSGLIARLGIGGAVVQMPRQGRPVVADLYRRASVVLMPSELEGFGLPVVEALGCGAVVVASDIPVFQEVGADAVLYCPLAQVPAWVQTIRGLLTGGLPPPSLAHRLARAGQYSWAAYAGNILRAYQSL